MGRRPASQGGTHGVGVKQAWACGSEGGITHVREACMVSKHPGLLGVREACIVSKHPGRWG